MTPRALWFEAQRHWGSGRRQDRRGLGLGWYLSRVKEYGVYLDLRVMQGGDEGKPSWAPDLATGSGTRFIETA